MRRIYWIFVGPRETPSSRIHGYRVHEYLVRRGWDSRVLFGPLCWMTDPPLLSGDVMNCSAFQPGDVVVFQKVNGPKTRTVLQALRERGVATVYVDCDLPVKLNEAHLASTTVCSSEYLAAEYRRGGVANVCSIPDAFEWRGAPSGAHWGSQKDERRREHFRCVWFGNITPEKWAAVEDLRRLLAATAKRWSLVRVADHPASEVEWRLGTAWQSIAECDAAVIPGSSLPEASAKSSNKAIQAMALGLPVLAYPIPAYSEVIHPGRNGFLCRTDGEWVRAFRALENPPTLARMSRRAYRYASRHFSIERIGPLWESVLAEAGWDGSAAARTVGDGTGEADLQNLQAEIYARATDGLVNRVCFA